jgi:hypothetical protein
MINNTGMTHQALDKITRITPIIRCPLGADIVARPVTDDSVL